MSTRIAPASDPYAAPINRNAPYRVRFGTCEVGIREEDGARVVDIAPIRMGRDRFVLSECFYRVALYIEGYRGALEVPSERLFASTARGFWAGQAQWVGPTATLVPARLSRTCPDLARMYYRDDFVEEVVRKCLPAR